MGEKKFQDRRLNRAGKCNVELGGITQHNVLQLKKLNETVFPVTYDERFYNDVVHAGDYARFVYFNDTVAGAVCCRAENKEGVRKLYILTLGTLAPYRRFGLGTTLLEHVFSICEKDKTIKSIYLHVQVNNESALRFYQKFGFKETDVAKNYYKRITPNDAFILEKIVNED